MREIRIKISGGYHNRIEIKMTVDVRFVETRDERFLSDYQRRRLNRHFCGIKGCACGSHQRANIIIENGGR